MMPTANSTTFALPGVTFVRPATCVRVERQLLDLRAAFVFFDAGNGGASIFVIRYFVSVRVNRTAFIIQVSFGLFGSAGALGKIIGHSVTVGNP